MKNKILKVCLLLFSFLFLIFPTLFLLKDNFSSLFFSVIILLLILLFAKKINVFLDKLNGKYLLIILILAILTRITSAIILSHYIIPISDFGKVYNNALISDYNTTYYHIFSHWLLYPNILSIVFKVFGSSYLVAYLFNAFVQIITIIFLYLLSKELFKNKKYAFIVSLIYIFLPINILYVSILTPEHIGVLLISISIYLILVILNKLDSKKNYIISIIIGVCLGFSKFFKNFAPVILIALLIILFLYYLKSDKKLIKNIGFILIIFISYFLTTFFTYQLLDNIVGGKYKVARNITMCYLNVGLNSAGSGGYNAELYNEYFNLYKANNYDYKKTNDIIAKSLLKDIKKQNKMALIKKIAIKSGIIFSVANSTGSSQLDFLIGSLNPEKTSNINNIFEKINVVNGICFFTIIITMILGLFQVYKKRNIKGYFIYITYFGCCLLLILIEAQTRYTYVIQIFMIMTSIYGMKYLYDKRKRTDYEKIFKIIKN